MNHQIESSHLFESVAQSLAPHNTDLLPRITARLRERRFPMRTLRTKPVFVLLGVALTLLLFTGVAYAIGRSMGFIPGYGFTEGDVYVLNAPVEVDENGVVISVKNAVYDGSKFWVEVNVSGLPNGLDFSQLSVLLPSGEKIQPQFGSTASVEDSIVHLTYIFSTWQGNPRHVILLFENFDGQILKLPLELRPIRSDEIIPVLPTESAPLQGEMQAGMALVLDNVAPDKDKTVFQVSLHFEQNTMQLNGPWNVILTDADGRIYPLRDITPEGLATSGSSKVYETVPFTGSEKLTLSLAAFPDSEKLTMMIGLRLNEAGFMFDPGVSPQVGQTWTLDENVQAAGYPLHLTGARLVAPNELLFDFDSPANVTGVMLYSEQASGSGGEVPKIEGGYTGRMTFGKIPAQPFMVYVTNIYYTAQGEWKVEWQPSAAPLEAAGLSTSTPMPTPERYVTPTFVTSDPLVQEVLALAQQFDASLRAGPGWVHVIWENTAENIQEGQTYPPPYYQDEQWYEVDAEGWVLRNLTTHRDAQGEIIQQAVWVNGYSVNFTTGDTFTFPIYQLSMDMLTQDLASAASYNAKVLREETQCEDGSPCLLVTIVEQYGGRKVWINLETGQQVKFQTFRPLPDNQERVDTSQTILVVEKVAEPPQDVLDLFARVVVP